MLELILEGVKLGFTAFIAVAVFYLCCGLYVFVMLIIQQRK
jgi:hypothetical protein